MSLETHIFHKLADPNFFGKFVFTYILGEKGPQIELFTFFETLIDKGSCNCYSYFPIINPIFRKNALNQSWPKGSWPKMLLINRIDVYFFACD